MGEQSPKRAGKSRPKHDPASRFPRREYERELMRLQGELVKLKEWVRTTDQRLVILFEGRDAAGKGGVIKRITEYLNPRVARTVALPAPTERERGQWYFQRYIAHLPAAGEIVLFDRSWYNRAGVEHVMGFCTPDEYRRFLHQCADLRAAARRGRHPRSSSTGSRSATRSRSGAFARGSRIRYGAGSSRRWTSSRARAGSTSRTRRTRCSSTPTSPRRRGTSSRATTSAARGSTASRTSSRSIPYEDVIEPPLELPPRPEPDDDYERPPRDALPLRPGLRGDAALAARAPLPR